MTTPTHPSASIHAPAKINLGIEIIGKRADGYHEIRTVMAMIDLVDDITIRIAPPASPTRLTGFAAADVPGNLITRAVERFSQATGIDDSYEIDVIKRIPFPGGLGGASSNAAATLAALNALHGEPLTPAALADLGGELGADVPFFIGSPVALAEGIGAKLTPLPHIHGWVVLVVPRVAIPEKTRTLYGSLQPEDFSNDDLARQTVAEIAAGQLPRPASLRNAFLRPLSVIAPVIPQVIATMHESGCHYVALTGAGPGLYTLCADHDEAHALLDVVTPRLAAGTLATVVPFSAAPPMPRLAR